MNTATATKNVLKKDVNGDWYSIPENLIEVFIRVNEEIQNSDMFSSDWHAACFELDEHFKEYQV
jgi:hypothetical protein